MSRRKGNARHPDLDQSWAIYTKCWMCGSEMCINNYSDRKPRVKHLRIAGHIICAWCRGRGGIAREFVKLVLLAEKTAELAWACGAEDDEGCKCTPHVAQRVLASLDLSPEKFYRRKVSVSSGDV